MAGNKGRNAAAGKKAAVARGKFELGEAIVGSYELIREHYREVLVPLFILALLTAPSYMGGSSFSKGFNSASYQAREGGYGGIANAMAADAGAFSVALGGLFIVLIIGAIIAIFIMQVLDKAIWFYVFEHFYALLAGKRAPKEWKARMKRHAGKAFFFVLFWWALIGLFVIAVMLPALMFTYKMGMAQFVLSGVTILFAFALLSFMLSTLWIYFAMDGFGLFDSAKKSFSLVSKNFVQFLVYAVVFFLIYIAGAVVTFASCCLANVVGPIISVAITLLSGVTLMKMKLALEKK